MASADDAPPSDDTTSTDDRSPSKDGTEKIQEDGPNSSTDLDERKADDTEAFANVQRGGDDSKTMTPIAATVKNESLNENSVKKEEYAIVRCATSVGPLTMHFHRSWSPHGYDRATTLFERHYYDHSHFFRVVPHFLVQFGIGYVSDPQLREFAESNIPDDPKRSDLLPFREGMMSFAGSGPNSRSSQLFIAYDNAKGLGESPWETPFGEVMKDSLDTVRKFYHGYGDMPPWGKGPKQGAIRNRGSSYIEKEFPLLDKFDTCKVERVASLPKHTDNTKEASGYLRRVEVTKNYNPLKILGVEKQQSTVLVLILTLIVVTIAIFALGIFKRRKSKVEKSV